MNDLKGLFQRQAEWQRDQAKIPWEEKLRLSVVMRQALLALKWPQHRSGTSHGSDEQSERPDR